MIEATMYFPLEEDEEKRQKLACFFDFHRCVSFELLTPDDKTCSGRQVILGYYGRYLDELGVEYDKIVSRAYYAAHWLRYRLYASKHYPALNTTNRWEFYVEEDVVWKVPPSWITGRTRIRQARKEFASVAHLWLAEFDQAGVGFPPFPIKGLMRPPPPPPRRDHFEVFMRRANGYYHAAREAGIYSTAVGSLPIEKVWQLGDEIGASPIPDISSPDILVPDFDPVWYQKKYQPRAMRLAARN